MTTGVEFLWRAAGCPRPTTSEGELIPTRDMRGARCAATGLPAEYALTDAISDNFTTVKNASRAWPFGGEALSAAAVWCARTVALRCALFFAREDGIWFEAMRPLSGCAQRRRMDPLATLLNPPDPPFVACLPLYGVDHGGEANAERAVWWEREAGGSARLLLPKGPWVRRVDASKPVGPTRPVDKPLIKLQSKHTAIYCRIAHRRDVYPLQIDDERDVVVDVALWSRLRVVAEDLLAELRAHGVGAVVARDSLTTGGAPFGAPLRIVARWPEMFAPLQPFIGAAWWPLFTQLLPMPDLRPSSPSSSASEPNHDHVP